ncbi:MAG: pro-sigmaK processing inhibitor BofA family protein [Oscillospiraceae bacterium]
MDTVENVMETVSAEIGIAPGIITVVLVVLAVLLFTKPLKLVVKLLINTALGFAALILINKFGASIGVTIGVNWLNAAVVGILGLPGVALLLALKWLMLI